MISIYDRQGNVRARQFGRGRRHSDLHFIPVCDSEVPDKIGEKGIPLPDGEKQRIDREQLSGVELRRSVAKKMEGYERKGARE